MVILWLFTPFFIIELSSAWTGQPSTRAQPPILLFQPMIEWRTQLPFYKWRNMSKKNPAPFFFLCHPLTPMWTLSKRIASFTRTPAAMLTRGPIETLGPIYSFKYKCLHSYTLLYSILTLAEGSTWAEGWMYTAPTISGPPGVFFARRSEFSRESASR
jgi:hypothetical protein